MSDPFLQILTLKGNIGGNAIGIKLILSVFYLSVVSLALFILGWDNYTVIICFLFAVENVIKSFQTAMYSSFQAHENDEVSGYYKYFAQCF